MRSKEYIEKNREYLRTNSFILKYFIKSSFHNNEQTISNAKSIRQFI